MMAAGAVPGAVTAVATTAVSAAVATATVATAAVPPTFRKGSPWQREQQTRDRQRGGREPHDGLFSTLLPVAILYQRQSCDRSQADRIALPFATSRYESWDQRRIGDRCESGLCCGRRKGPPGGLIGRPAVKLAASTRNIRV